MGRFKPQRYTLLATILAMALLADIFWLHTFASLENRLSDVMVARHALGSVPDADIVIVDIDERSLSLMADSVGRWPWPRSLHAELVEGIERQHPKALVFDILFSDADLARPEGDQYFAEAIRANSNLYFPMLLLNDTNQSSGVSLAQYGAALGIKAGPAANPEAKASFVLPLPVMVESGRIGVHNAVADSDGVVRGYPLYLDVDDWRVSSLPARVATGLGYTLPAGNEVRLNWHGKALSYQRVSYADIYTDLQRKQPLRSPNEFTGKIVIIGATANGLHDVRATPIDSFYVGVEILATAIDNLKNADPLRRASPIAPAVLGLFLLGMLALALTHAPHLLRIGAALALASIASLLTAYFALGWRWLLLLLTPLIFAWAYYLIAALMEYRQERKAREMAIKTFGRFLDPRVVQALVTRGETIQSLSGKSCEISMLFSDIRGFTGLSESSAPEQVVELLNAYFTQQVAAVFAHEGTLDKYIGDAIMAFWGAPSHQPDHALRAVTAALDMSDRLEQFRNQDGLGYGLEIGIGIHSGPAVVGFIGSENHQNYTAVGDTVNLASRIEGQTKGVTRVLVSQDTKRMCEEQAGAGACPFEFVDKGEFQVKGRAQIVRLFEPIRAKA